MIAGLEPEEECPILFLRLRKAGRAAAACRSSRWRRSRAAASRSFGDRGRRRCPADEAEVLSTDEAVAAALAHRAALIIVGERLATSPGALSAAAALADRTGAKLAWVPRRAGDRGAVEAGCLPTLLPGGRPVTDAGGPRGAGVRVGPGRRRAAERARSRHRRHRRGGRVRQASAACSSRGVDPGDLADPRAGR